MSPKEIKQLKNDLLKQMKQIDQLVEDYKNISRNAAIRRESWKFQIKNF